MLKLFRRDTLTNLAQQAAAADRLRTNLNIHPQLDDPVQRFFNAMQPGTYVRPHRHVEPPRWELFLVLQGRLALLVFDDEGIVLERQEIQVDGPVTGVELESGRWHALVVLAPAVMFELKQGPYSALTDKDFASWAPPEGAPEGAALVAWYEKARPGDRFEG